MTRHPLEVQILGCGDAMGSGGRLQTCFSLRRGKQRVLVDCGATAMMAIRRFGIDPLEIDLILISHLHGDHFGGLPFFLLDARLVSRRQKPLVIAGPPGLEARLWRVMETFYSGSTKARQRFEVRFEELVADETLDLGLVQVTAIEVVHQSGAPAYGLRVQWDDRCFAYSGDTEWTEALLAIARQADLFICESAFFDRQIPNHMPYATLVQRRADLECKHMLLTHLSQEMLERVGDLEIDCAEDGQVLRL